MANIDGAFGFRPVRMLNGGKIPMRKYRNKGATTAIWKGDLVTLTANDMSVLRNATTTPSVDTIGVSANYAAAGTALQDVWVYDDPTTVFEIQCDGTTDSIDAYDYVGATAILVTAAGNTTTGVAKLEVDSSDITSSGTATDTVVKIIGVGKSVKNDSTSSHPVVEVLLMNHMYGGRILTASI